MNKFKYLSDSDLKLLSMSQDKAKSVIDKIFNEIKDPNKLREAVEEAVQHMLALKNGGVNLWSNTSSKLSGFSERLMKCLGKTWSQISGDGYYIYYDSGNAIYEPIIGNDPYIFNYKDENELIKITPDKIKSIGKCIKYNKYRDIVKKYGPVHSLSDISEIYNEVIKLIDNK